eukprot:15258903-Heterocapsa_arctica.AAC.1
MTDSVAVLVCALRPCTPRPSPCLAPARKATRCPGNPSHLGLPVRVPLLPLHLPLARPSRPGSALLGSLLRSGR